MGIGFLEIVVIGVFALILFGPSKLPEMMRQAAKYYVQFRRSSNEFKSSFDHMLRDAENSLRTQEMERLKALLNSEVSKVNSLIDPITNLGSPNNQGLNSVEESRRLISEQGLAGPHSVDEKPQSEILIEPSLRSPQPFDWGAAAVDPPKEASMASADSSAESSIPATKEKTENPPPKVEI